MAQQQQFQKVKFRIVSASSEETDYPVQELLTQSPQSKGWQSARFCDFPQEITLQFMSPIRLKQIQFLSHQSKIASKIEIYVYLPDPTLPYQNSDIKYKKLGYLSLDSNERTGYQARELKSVYVDAPCQFMKLLLHKQHINKYNLFNQVGLIALSCFGENLGVGPSPSLQQKQHYNEIQFETQFDQVTLDRLRQLEQAKEHAIKVEDYEEAKRIKDTIERLKTIGVQLRQLDERKAIAVQNEDFDSARIIKSEIERLRNAIAPEDMIQRQQQQNYEMQNQQYMQQQQQQPMDQQYMQQQMMQNDPGYQQQMQQQQYMDQRNQQYMQQDPQYAQQEQDQFVQNQQQEYQQQQQNLEEVHQEKQQDFQRQQPQQQNTRAIHNDRDHDEQVIPAIRNNGMNDQDGGIQGGNQDQDMEAEPLSNAAQKLAMPLIPVLGEGLCRQIFSKNWQIKTKALEFLQQQSANPNQLLSQNRTEVFTALMGAVSNTIQDRIAGTVITSIQTFDTICNNFRDLVGPPRGDVATYIDTCLTTMVEKIGENQKRISEPAEQAFFSAGNNGMIQNAHIISMVAKDSTLPKKLINSHKHITARLNLLNQFVQRYQIGNKNVPLEPVVEFATKQISHQNQDVRNASISLLGSIHRVIGDGKLRPHLSAVPQQQMDILEEEFESGGGPKGGASKPKQARQQQKVEVTTNIQGGGGGGAGGNKGKTAGGATKKPPQQNAVSCEFCGQSDPAFADSNKLDIHLWKECPILHNCQHCAQVVEVSTLASHLLEECEARRQFRKCPRCKEPIKLKDYEHHTQEMSCLQAKPITVANRCCLCHQDIPAGMSGWNQHLVVDGCPNNEKTVG